MIVTSMNSTDFISFAKIQVNAFVLNLIKKMHTVAYQLISGNAKHHAYMYDWVIKIS